MKINTIKKIVVISFLLNLLVGCGGQSTLKKYEGEYELKAMYWPETNETVDVPENTAITGKMYISEKEIDVDMVLAGTPLKSNGEPEEINRNGNIVVYRPGESDNFMVQLNLIIDESKTDQVAITYQVSENGSWGKESDFQLIFIRK
ncbi:MAG: hypothetical protein IJI66_09785 [Erysipelotrichaceae bacterium]|nr:hypothetical protein [Erysipelotrichaceae bacterium]